MAVAGKVAITLSTENGGAWSADVTYDRLVAVKHNNNLYISRKTVANVEPPNDEFWFLALEGFGGEDVEALIDRMNELSDLIQAIIDGSTQVGNAKTLDGHGAEYFFPKSGGTINGNLYVESAEAKELTLALQNAVRNVMQRVYASGIYRLYDATNNNIIINSAADGTNTFNGTASGNLPLTGGRIENDSYTLYLKRTSASGAPYLIFENGNGVLSSISSNINTYELVTRRQNTGTVHTILDTGNKPTGTYTGNGSATARTIATNGIGSVCVITATSSAGAGFMIVTANGSVGLVAGTSYDLTYDVCRFVNGQITMATDRAMFNASGTTYSYQVL